MSDHAAMEEPAERILWGRVLALGAVVLLAFLLGRATVDEGVPRNELDQAQAAVVQLSQENAGLQRQLATVSTQAPTAPTAPPPPPAPADVAPPDADGADSSADSGSSSVLDQPQEGDEQLGDAAGQGVAAGEQPPGGPAGAANERAYRVRSGDSLASIATRLYGDEQSWRLIADANQLTANQLTVGQVLRIPPSP